MSVLTSDGRLEIVVATTFSLLSLRVTSNVSLNSFWIKILARMKDISADPPESVHDDLAESISSLSSPSTSDGSLLALADLALDRSEELVSPDPPVSEISTDPVTSTPGRKSASAKRYPSFRDIFMKPLRGRRRSSQLSSSPEDRSDDVLKRLKIGEK